MFGNGIWFILNFFFVGDTHKNMLQIAKVIDKIVV